MVATWQGSSFGATVRAKGGATQVRCATLLATLRNSVAAGGLGGFCRLELVGCWGLASHNEHRAPTMSVGVNRLGLHHVLLHLLDSGRLSPSPHAHVQTISITLSTQWYGRQYSFVAYAASSQGEGAPSAAVLFTILAQGWVMLAGGDAA